MNLMSVQKTLEERWTELIQKQQIKKVLGGIEETEKLITGDFPSVKQYCTYVIKINDLGSSTFCVTRFLEEVFGLLTSDVLQKADRKSGLLASNAIKNLRKYSNGSKIQYLGQTLDVLDDPDYDTKTIDDQIKSFRQKLCQIQLKGAVPREPQGTNLISTTGLSRYDDVINSIQNALVESNCSYPVCSLLFTEDWFTLGMQRNDNHASKDKVLVKDLEALYRQRLEDKTVPKDLRIFNAILAAKHNEQYFLLISKNAAESFPFIRDKTREDYTYNLLQEFQLNRMQDLLEQHGVKTLDKNRFSDDDKRIVDLKCHMIQDIINLFQLKILVKIRHTCQKFREKYNFNGQYIVADFSFENQFPVVFYSPSLRIDPNDVFHCNVLDLQNTIDTIQKVFMDVMSTLDVQWPHENEAFQVAKNHFYKNVSVEKKTPQQIISLESKCAASRKLEIIKWFNTLTKDNDMETKKVKWTSQQIQQNKNVYKNDVKLDIKHVENFAETIVDEINFINLLCAEIANASQKERLETGGKLISFTGRKY